MPHHDGQTRPSWSRTAGAAHFASFDQFRGSTVVDVAVVGGGIAGLTTAYLLARAGKSVLLLDDSGPASGESARTSAHLGSYIDDGFLQLEQAVGVDNSRLAHESHAHAIDFIESLCRREHLDCDFKRLDAYLFLAEGDDPDTLTDELAACQRAGIEVHHLPQTSLPNFPSRPALRFPRQARFHPLKYYAALTRLCLQHGVRFSTGTQITDCSGGSPVTLTSHDGSEIKAASAVIATNVPSPINDWMGVYLKQAPYRTYMLAFDIDPASLTDALYWDTADPYHYIRLDHNLLLVGGEDHKVGQPPHGGESTPFSSLEAWTRAHFPSARQVLGRWSGQVQEPDDFLAYLGLAPTRGGNVYCITGDSGMGLTHGTLGAQICSDLILSRPNPYSLLYSPTRKPSRSNSLRQFASEQANVAAQYLSLLTSGQVSSPDQIPPGSGAVLREGLSKVALYKSPDGALTKCSALCTHLGCVVNWNDLEKSWDCPCHGSRFSPEGHVLTGPAVSPLKRLDE